LVGIVGSPGWGGPAAGGSNLQNIQFGQGTPGPKAINTQNPINATWHGTWTPANYANRTVSRSVTPLPPAASARRSSSARARPSLASAFALESYGNVTIPVVPAPASLALLGLGGLIAGCRRRSPPTTRTAPARANSPVALR